MRRAILLVVGVCSVGACAGRAGSPPAVTPERQATRPNPIPGADSGVRVTVLPGGRIRIAMRTGPNTATPVFVIDGVVYAPSDGSAGRIEYWSESDGRRMQRPLPDVAPNEIEAIEVLKGPIAIERFGPRARDGAVVIRTSRSAAP